MADKLAAQIAKMEKTYRDYKKEFQRGGIDATEAAVLKSVEQKIAELKASAATRKKGPGVTEITFGDKEVDEVEVLAADKKDLEGFSPVQHVRNALADLQSHVNLYWDNCTRGVIAFGKWMEGEARSSAVPKYLEAGIKTACGEAFKTACSKLTAAASVGAPGLGTAIGAMIAVAQSLVEEGKRAAKAAEEVKVKDLITEIVHGIGPCQKKMMATVKASVRPIQADLEKALAEDRKKGLNKNPKGTQLVGKTGEILVALKRGIAGFQQSVPSSQKFQEMFATSAANTPGMSDKYISHGARPSGTLHIKLNLWTDLKTWMIEKVGSKWELESKGPKAGNMADALSQALTKQGKKVWEVELPKMVQLDIDLEDARPTRGYIHFVKDPNQFEVRTNESPSIFKEAWPLVKDAALKVNKLE